MQYNDNDANDEITTYDDDDAYDGIPSNANDAGNDKSTINITDVAEKGNYSKENKTITVARKIIRKQITAVCQIMKAMKNWKRKAQMDPA